MVVLLSQVRSQTRYRTLELCEAFPKRSGLCLRYRTDPNTRPLGQRRRVVRDDDGVLNHTFQFHTISPSPDHFCSNLPKAAPKRANDSRQTLLTPPF